MGHNLLENMRDPTDTQQLHTLFLAAAHLKLWLYRVFISDRIWHNEFKVQAVGSEWRPGNMPTYTHCQQKVDLKSDVSQLEWNAASLCSRPYLPFICLIFLRMCLQRCAYVRVITFLSNKVNSAWDMRLCLPCRFMYLHHVALIKQYLHSLSCRRLCLTHSTELVSAAFIIRSLRSALNNIRGPQPGLKVFASSCISRYTFT